MVISDERNANLFAVRHSDVTFVTV